MAFPRGFLTHEILWLFGPNSGRQVAWTVEEIWFLISSGGVPGSRSKEEYRELRFWYGHSARTGLEAVRETLVSLADLGLVQKDTMREESSGFERWRIGEAWKPPERPYRGGGNGGNDGPGAPDGGGGGDDGGGGGLRETLGHPVLFALDPEDFDNLVDGLFEGVPR